VIDVVVGPAPAVAPDGTPGAASGATLEATVGASLVVRVAPYPGPAGNRTAREAKIGVAVADPALAQALTTSVAAAIQAAVAESKPPEHTRTVRLRSRKRLAREAGQITGAIAIVPVTARNARHLVEFVDGIRAAGAIGVQLVWDGATPPRATVERHVFAALERARATPNDPPVVLATSDQPASALHLLIAHRQPPGVRQHPAWPIGCRAWHTVNAS